MPPSPQPTSKPVGGGETPESLAPAASFTCSGETAIPASLAPGPWYLGVIVDPNGLVAESDETNNSRAASNGPIALNYPLPDNFTISPSGLGFSAPAGGAQAAPQDLLIGSTTPVAFRVRSNATWLTTSVTSGTAPATIQVRVNSSGLAAGHYWGEIGLWTGDDPANATFVPIGFTVSAPNPSGALSVSPSGLFFNYVQGTGNRPENRLYVTAAGPNYWFLATMTDAGNWLQPTSLPAGVIAIAVDPAGMAVGTYRGNVITFCPQCSPSIVRTSVTLDVTAGLPAQSPARVSVAGGGQTAPVGSVLPIPVVVDVFNASGRPIADAQVTFTTENATVNPSSGRTNSAGRLLASVMLGPTAGPASFTTTVAGFATPIKLTAIATAAVVPEPQVIITDVVDGGSFQSGIAQSGWVTIRGTSLSATTRTWEGKDFSGERMPTELDGVKVSMNGRPAVVYYVSPTQLNVLAPLIGTSGTANVTVTNRQGTASKTVPIQSVRPSFFMLDPENRRYVAGVHLDGFYVGKPGLYPAAPDLTRPLTSRGRAQLYGTGWGATSPAQPEGLVFSDARPLANASNVHITIGGLPATVEFAGAISPGLYQFNIVAPDLPAGDHAIIGEINGASTQANAFITLAAASPPAITALTPASSQVGQVIDRLTISGQNLAGVTGVAFSPATGITASLLSVTDNEITVRVAIAANAATGQRNVTAVAGNRSSNALPFSITSAPPPSITALTPSSAQAGQIVETLTISGENLVGVTGVVFSPATGVTTSVVSVTATEVVIRVALASSAASGRRDVSVVVGARSSNALPFTITAAPPRITRVNPSSAEVSEIVPELRVSGENLPLANATIEFDLPQGLSASGTFGLSTSFVSKLLLVNDDAVPGTRSLTVVTTAGRTNTLEFEVKPKSGAFAVSNLRIGNVQETGPTTILPITMDFSDPSGGAHTLTFAVYVSGSGFFQGTISGTGANSGQRSGTLRFDLILPGRNLVRFGASEFNFVNASGHRSNRLRAAF